MSDAFVELILCSVLLAGGLVHAMRIHRNGSRACVADVAAWATAIVFGLAPWTVLAYAGRLESSAERETLLAAYGCVALHVAGLLVIAGAWRAWRGRAGRLEEPFTPGSLGGFFRAASEVRLRSVVMVLAFVWVVRAIMALRFGLLVSGSAMTERVLALPYPVVIVRGVSAALALGLWLWLPAVLLAGNRARWLSVPLFLAECGFQFLRGRRLLLALLVCGFAVHVARAKSLRLSHGTIGIVVAALLLQLMFPAFLALRGAYDVQDSRGAIHSLRAAVESIRETGSYAEASAAFRRNMETRPLIMAWNCELVESRETRGPMWGGAIANTALWVIPSLILPGKRHWSSPEDNVARHYGMPANDYASNWPAYGYADFGILGGAVTGILMGLLLLAAQTLAGRVWSWAPFVALAAVGCGFLSALSVEQSPTRTWDTLRVLLVLIAGAACIRLCSGVAREHVWMLPEPRARVRIPEPSGNGGSAATVRRDA